MSNADDVHDKAEAQRKQSLTHWHKGMPSPNPGGRPKQIARVVELARERTEKAITTLEEIMNDRKAGATARVAAASALLDRGWGKPLTVSALFDVQEDSDQPKLSPLERLQRIAFMIALAKRQSQDARAIEPAGAPIEKACTELASGHDADQAILQD